MASSFWKQHKMVRRCTDDLLRWGKTMKHNAALVSASYRDRFAMRRVSRHTVGSIDFVVTSPHNAHDTVTAQ